MNRPAGSSVRMIIMRLLLLVVLAAVGGAAAVSARASGTSIPQELLADLGVDVGSTQASVPEIGVANARAALGRSDSPIDTISGLGSRFVSDDRKPVVVFVFSGGTEKVVGPRPDQDVRGRVVAVDFSGVVVDADSGEVLKSFTFVKQP